EVSAALGRSFLLCRTAIPALATFRALPRRRGRRALRLSRNCHGHGFIVARPVDRERVALVAYVGVSHQGVSCDWGRRWPVVFERDPVPAGFPVQIERSVLVRGVHQVRSEKRRRNAGIPFLLLLRGAKRKIHQAQPLIETRLGPPRNNARLDRLAEIGCMAL